MAELLPDRFRPLALPALPPQALLTAAALRAAEAALIRAEGLEQAAQDVPEPGDSGQGRSGLALLMQRAGLSAFAALRARWPLVRRLLVLAGKGNNGGDAFVLAAAAHAAGYAVQVLCAAGQQTTAEARAARAALAPALLQPLELPTLPGALATAELVVDGLYGFGLHAPLAGADLQVIAHIRNAGKPVLALDLPSGLSADRGLIGPVLPATLTVSFLALKRGLVTGRAREAVGELWLAPLTGDGRPFVSTGPEPEPESEPESAVWRDRRSFGTLLPRRSRAGHKGDYGHVLVVGGAEGMGGAVQLSCAAALRSGAGLVSAYCHSLAALAMSSAVPEVMAHRFGRRPQADALHDLVERASVLAVGPGLSRQDFALEVVRQTVTQAQAGDKALVLDADGLWALAELARLTGVLALPAQTVLTPHPGEAARLLGISNAAVEADRYAAARQLAQRFGAVVLLKGAGTLIADGRHCTVIADGNPGMASGGMGDTLTGIIAALLAQGLPAFAAAERGAALHAAAADRTARAGERGLTASDVIDEIRAELNAEY